MFKKLAILEKEVWVRLGSRNIKYWEQKGYNIPRREIQGRLSVAKGTKIKVKVDDLSDGSSVKVTKICDDCGKYLENKCYNDINLARNNTDGKDRCTACGRIYSGKMHKYNSPYKKSLEYLAPKMIKNIYWMNIVIKMHVQHVKFIIFQIRKFGGIVQNVNQNTRQK